MSLASRSLRPQTNLDLSWDTRYPNGDKPQVQQATLDINLAAFQAAQINLLSRPQNTAIALNYRQYLTGTSAASALLQVNTISGGLGLWTFDSPTDSVLTNPGTSTGSGSLQVTATDGVNTVNFSVQQWSILATAQQHTRIWFPGHGGASGGTAQGGDVLNKFQPEILDMLKTDAVNKYRLFISWGHQDMGPSSFTGSVGGATSGTLTAAPQKGNNNYFVKFGNGQFRRVVVSGATMTWTGALNAGAVTTCHVYYFQLVDDIFALIRGKFTKPKYVQLIGQPMTFNGGTRGATDYSFTPKFIATNSAYGPSPDGSTFGWWGCAAGQPYTYTTAVYRPAVAAQYGLWGEAVGACYNTEPLFYGFGDQEDSAVTGNALARNSFGSPASNDGSYSDDIYIASRKSIYLQWQAAMPSKNIIIETTFMNDVSKTQDFINWQIANGFIVGTADTLGLAWHQVATHLVGGNWGIEAYAGVKASGSTATVSDRRGYAACMLDIEGPDISPTVSSTGIGTTPKDLIDAINQVYKATDAFWCHVPGGKRATNPATGQPYPALTWADVESALVANPLTSTAYPGNYP
jgi:hypothetical protein